MLNRPALFALAVSFLRPEGAGTFPDTLVYFFMPFVVFRCYFVVSFLEYVIFALSLWVPAVIPMEFVWK